MIFLVRGVSLAFFLRILGLESEDKEVTKPSAATRPSAAISPSTATRPSATTKLYADKEKRATNKRIKEEVLQLMPQFKSVLSMPHAFGTNH